jgi:hypothetical protein
MAVASSNCTTAQNVNKIMHKSQIKYEKGNKNEGSQLLDPKISNRYVSLPYIPILDEKIKQTLPKHNISTCFKLIRPLSNFLNSGKDITRNSMASGVYSIPCSCGKFYTGRNTNNLWNDLLSTGIQ